MSIFDFASTGSTLLTLSSVAPTNIPVPARAEPHVRNAATTRAAKASLSTAAGYLVGECTVGAYEDLDEFAVGGLDPACSEPLGHGIRRSAGRRRQRGKLAAVPGRLVVGRPSGVAAESQQRRRIALDLRGDCAGDRSDVLVGADADELLRDERLLPGVLEQLRELERLPVGRDLRVDRSPHPRRDRLRGERDVAAFDRRGDE